MNVPSQPTFQRLETKYFPEWGFRPRTPMFPHDMNFIFLNGGMGDYICWMPAIQWLGENCPWILGTLVAPDYFRPLAEYWLKTFPHWKYARYEDTKNNSHFDEHPYRGPLILNQQALNATGGHLLTCGWVYMTNKEKAPPGWEYYPRFKPEDLEAVSLPAEAKPLEGKDYAIITTGITTDSRKVPGKYWNPIIKHVVDRGLIPVFLGKANVITGNPRNIHTSWDSDTNFVAGVDLRDKTEIFQAAALIHRAKMIIGHDNGLLHLAGCTDTPIIFGYNIASPEHREPKRKAGKVFNVFVDPSELVCSFCQSRTNFVIGYNFQQCFYGDLKCIDMLFENDGERWKRQIDLALNL